MGIYDSASFSDATLRKEFAPEGWHVPSDVEWTTLEEHLIANFYNYDQTNSENKIAKGMASTTGWYSSTNEGVAGNDQSSNNSSGFNAFPEGNRNDNGSFGSGGSSAIFWSSTENNTNIAWSRNLFFNLSNLLRSYNVKHYGFSVRFVRDGDIDEVNVAPLITLIGDAIISLNQGDIYTEQGATASDTEDGDISSAIVIGGDTVDTNTPGTYAVTYTVTDADGNTTVATRNVEVNAVGACDADETQTLTAVNFHLTFLTNPGTTQVKSSENFKFFQDNVTYEYADNPAVSAGNNSCKVAKVTNSNVAAYDNLQFDVANKLIFTDGSNFTIKVYSPQSGYKVTLKLEDKANSGAFKQVASGVTAKTDEWEELTISFNAADSNKYDKIVFFFDLETTNGNTYYFDDLKLNLGTGGGGGGTGGNTVGGGDGCADTTTCPDAPTGELLFNGDFEACDCDWQLLDPVGSTISTSISNGGSKSGQIQGKAGPAVGL
jgi:uncharacterized protein (TIGR02145 family)